MTGLEELRAEIDMADFEILSAIARRNKVAEKVGKFKKAKKLAVFVPAREKALIQERKKTAKKLKVSQELVEKVFKELIKESRSIQKAIIEGKK